MAKDPKQTQSGDSTKAKAEAESRARQAEAKADAEKARAEAETARVKAEAEARQTELANQRAREEREANERKEARDLAEKQRQEKAAKEDNPLEKAWKVGTALAGAGTGIYAGHKLADRIETRQSAFREAAGRQLTELGAKAEPALKAIGNKTTAGKRAVDTLAGVVQAADKMGLTRTKGPSGLTMAGLLLAEGAMSRFVLAPQTDNSYARDMLTAIGTGSLFAATSMLGERAVQNATPQAVNGAKGFAAVEAARSAVQRHAPDLLKSSGMLDKVAAAAKAAPKTRTAAAVALVASAGTAIYSLFAPDKNAVSSAIDVARQAAGRVTESMGQKQTLGAGSDVKSQALPDGMTDGYTRMQNGKSVRVDGYRTPK